MAKFRLVEGRHADIAKSKDKKSPRIFKKGDIVESDKDLTKVFPNKFLRVGDAPADTEEAPKQQVRKTPAPEPEEPERDVANAAEEGEEEAAVQRRRSRRH